MQSGHKKGDSAIAKTRPYGRCVLPLWWNTIKERVLLDVERPRCSAGSTLIVTVVVFCCSCYYLRRGGYVFVVVCLSVSNFAQKNFQTDWHGIFREGWQWASEQMVKFWWRSGSPPADTGIVFRIRHYWDIRKVVNGHKSAAHSDSPECQMAALVRHALAEVCTVLVLPVVSDLERTFIVIIFHYFFNIQHIESRGKLLRMTTSQVVLCCYRSTTCVSVSTYKPL